MLRKNTYTRVLRANGRCYTYTFNYSHSEDINTPHIKGEHSEYYKYSNTKRHVYIEDESLRTCEIIDPSVIGKRGRPKGSKDSYQRTRKSKED